MLTQTIACHSRGNPSLILIGVLWALTPAQCQDIAGVSLEDLANVEVTSVSKREQKLSSTAGAVFVISQDDIRRSGAASIPEVLRIVPGLHVARISASEWAISARGFNGRFANKMLVLIDGRSVYSSMFSGVFWENQDMVLEDIERIEVIRGPGATMWGANAVNGVISIITKKARDTQGTLASVSTGNRQTAVTQVRSGWELGKRAHLNTWGKFSGHRGFSKDDPFDDSFRSGRGGLRLELMPTLRDSITLRADGFRLTRSEPLSLPFEPVRSAKSAPNGFSVQGKWERAYSENGTITVQGYVDRSLMSLGIGDADIASSDAEYQQRVRVGSHDLMWGGGFRSSSERIRPHIVNFTNGNMRHHLVNSFIQDEIVVVPDKLSLSLGTKIENNDYTGWNWQPRAQAVWTPTARHSAWVSVARAVRTPSRVEYDINADFQPVLLPGLPPLLGRIIGAGDTIRNEELWAYESGFRLQPTKRVSVDIAGFFDSYNYLRSGEPGSPFPEFSGNSVRFILPVVLANGLRGQNSGVEVSSTYLLTKRWKLTGTYSWLNMALSRRPESNDVYAEADERNNPTHKGNLRSSIDLGRSFELDLSAYGASSAPNYRIAGYLTFDARIGWTPARFVDISFFAQNLFDRRYLEFRQEAWGLPSILGRSIATKITWRF